jgi:hypothetical protein
MVRLKRHESRPAAPQLPHDATIRIFGALRPRGPPISVIPIVVNRNDVAPEVLTRQSEETKNVGVGILAVEARVHDDDIASSLLQ